MDRLHPDNAAVAGDDSLNNVEKIVINNPVVGQTYTIKINHKGTLQRGQQAYSLLLSGIGGGAYCTSAATSSAGTRIDSVSISNIKNANPAGCTTYTNYTSQVVQIQPSQKIPFRIKLSSCDASTASRVVKVFIDYNNNGVFDANELAAQSPVLAGGSAVYADTITTPSNLTIGNLSEMRIVAQETTDPSTVNACGTYGNGETEDYDVAVVEPPIDLALGQIIAPISGDCSDTSQLVVVAIRNQGTDTVSNVPVTAVIQNGSTTVATLSEKYPGKIPPNRWVTYTFQQPFSSLASATYNITAYITLSSDQFISNDTATTSVTIADKPAAPEATGTVVGDSVTLKITNPGANSSYFWYNSATSDSSLFETADTSVNITAVPTGQTFYVGTGAQGYVGVKSKNDYTGGSGGGYQTPGGNFLVYNAEVPVILKSARLYTGYPGKVLIMVIDTSNTQPDGSYYYSVLSSTVIDVYQTSPTPKPGSVSGINLADTGAVFYLNLPLPAGRHLILDTTIDASVDSSAIGTASIFRNNNITGNPYPFTIPNIISITGNSAATKANPSQAQGYYYYMYNMKIQTQDCISSRAAVSVTVPTNVGFKVWPNPNPGVFNVFFDAGTSGNVSIELYNLLGQRCYSQSYSATGLFSTQINASNLITGMYILYVKAGNKSYHQKVLIIR
ncbi:MAG: T9SS type A sorting domain-containing protein [Bacteroidetes bacterium]|nr:T9SS type A sorting domain-containing protein [Bacteroidota bacterium]